MILTLELSEDINESLHWIDNLIDRYPEYIGTQEIYDGLKHIVDNYKRSQSNILSINLSYMILESIYWEMLKWIEITGHDAWVNCIVDCDLPEVDYYKIYSFAEEMVSR